MGKLDGRVAIITGAAQGIGAAYARRFAEEGAKVVIADILDATNVVNTIKQSGGDAIGLTVDVSDKLQVQEMVKTTIETYGKVDVMVPNAAMFAHLERHSFLEIDVDVWDSLMAVNVRGVFLCCQAVVPEMKKQGYGKIVNIASSTVQMGVPWMLHYVSSKGAVDAMTRALARELGDDGIRVNSIAPGLTMSEQVEARREDLQANVAMSMTARAFKRDELPDDLVGTAVFLASADSDFMTGQTIVVDGGLVTH
ncbi:MAG: glucose 1-dehydrogenase [Rhodospirillales bacterium]|nr:glucose 1-dehydrogenase [Rhodospirillales bacterium]